MIDYEDIDTPTWLRERSHLHPFVIHLKLWARWRDPRLWEQQMMGTWEVEPPEPKRPKSDSETATSYWLYIQDYEKRGGMRADRFPIR